MTPAITTTALRIAIRILILGCFMSATCGLYAHHAHATTLSGTVERIDRGKHLLLVKRDVHGEPLLLQWGRWTTFVKSGHIVSPEALSTGRAEIYYKTPFFGRPTLEKIVLQANPAGPAHGAPTALH